MAEKKVVVRVEGQGGQQLRAEFQGLGVDGQRAFEQIGGAQRLAATGADAHSRAINGEVIAFQQLRASLDPVYASAQRYEAVQQQVTAAVRQGIATQQEANRVIQLAEARYNRAGSNVVQFNDRMTAGVAPARNYGAAMVNASFQVQDFAVQVASGQSAMIAFVQQAPQLLGVLGVTGRLALFGAGIGTLIAVGGAVIPMLLRNKDAAKSLDDAIGDLTGSINDYKTNATIAVSPTAELRRQFGGSAEEARELYRAMAELSQLKAMQAVSASAAIINRDLRGIADELAKIDAIDQSALTYDFNLALGTEELKDSFGVTVEQARAVKAAMDDLAAAKGPEEVMSAISNLQQTLMGVRDETGIIPTQLQAAATAATEAAIAGLGMAKNVEDARVAGKSLADLDLASGIADAGAEALFLAQQMGVSLEKARAIANENRKPAPRLGFGGDADVPIPGVGSARLGYGDNPGERSTYRHVSGLDDPYEPEKEKRTPRNDAQRESERMQRERERQADGYYRQTRTPEEVFTNTVKELDVLKDGGFFTEAAGGQETYKRAVESARKTMEEAAQASDKMGQSIKEDFRMMVTDAANAGDHFVNLVSGILNQILDNMLDGPTQILGNAASSFISSFLPGMPSADGGGYTGSGPRTGGLDGKGGFLAMLHRDEVVTDLTKGQRVPGQGGGSRLVVEAVPNPYFDVRVREVSTQGDVRMARMQQRVMPAMQADNRRRGLSG